MSMDMGVTGAKRQSFSRSNPRELLRTLVEQHPQWSRERIFSELRDRVMGARDKAYLDTILEYWFANNYHSLVPEVDRAERQAARSKAASDVKAAIEDHIKIALLDMMMPNGKPLRQCTGLECARFSSKIGAWLLRISKQIKPTDIVGDVMTEKQLRQLYK
jgi:hypothetical protein